MAWGIFILLSFMCVGSVIAMMISKNPVHGALFLVLCFSCLGGIFGLADAPVAAVIQVIVYAGAIMVLFLFAVMTIRPGRDSLPERKRFIYPAAIFLCLILATELALAVVKSIRHVVLIVPPGPRDASGIGHLMFSTYLYPFEITSLLLVAALVGVMALAGKERR